jgi:hypothetical protein
VHYPFGFADGFHLLGRQSIPDAADGFEEMGIIFVDAITEVMTFQIGPQAFGWIQFRTVRRQRDQGDIVRHIQCFGTVPTGLIQDQNHLSVQSNMFTDKRQMCIHIIGIDCWCDQGGGITGLGIDRTEQIDPFVFGLL